MKGIVFILLFSTFSVFAEKIPSREKLWKKIRVLEERRDEFPFGNIGWWHQTSLGGYGELHFNTETNDGSDKIDFHRFVLFLSHEYSDSIRLFSELELEHALSGEGEDGEVELEQAYIEFSLSNSKIIVGQFLLPIGFLNEIHEPTTFFGVERNGVEKNIIPTTWWEAGIRWQKPFENGFLFDVALHSGLSISTSGSTAFNIRNARQKVSNARAETLSVTNRLSWNLPGTRFGLSWNWQDDLGQGSFVEDLDAFLFALDLDLERGPWRLKFLYAKWDLDGDAPKAFGKDKQLGWYIEPSYHFDSSVGEWGVFARYTYYDNEAGNSNKTENQEYHFGLNFWPHKNVVLKTDIQYHDDPTGKDDTILNLGIGFVF